MENSNGPDEIMGNNVYQESVDDEDDFQNIGKDEYRDVNIVVFTVNDQDDLRIWIYIN